MRAARSSLGQRMLDAGLGREVERYLEEVRRGVENPAPILFEGKYYRPYYGKIKS